MQQKIILITGASKGIGRFLAEYYLERGHVVIGCSRSPTVLESPNYHHQITDIMKAEDLADLFHYIKKNFNVLDYLINNAGIASMNHSMLTPLATVQKIFNTNTIATFAVCQEAAKLMMRSKSARIVNFSTVAVPLKLDGEAAYAASKAAVNLLTQIFAKELSAMNITVNAVGPTPIDTDLIKAVPSEKIEALIQKQAIKRKGTFADVANVIDFFLQESSNFVTGQIIYLGGVS